jgi:RpiB/LacA/LacB family sugar-phosphate isomerase
MHVTAGHEVIDSGAVALIRGDYPDFVIPLARAVAGAMVERGVATSGSGVGASACASKVPGVRAGLIHDHFSSRQGVEDDHMNIVCMGGRTVGSAWDLVETFLASKFVKPSGIGALSVRSLPSKHRQSANKAQLTTHERSACSQTRRYHEAEVRPKHHIEKHHSYRKASYRVVPSAALPYEYTRSQCRLD